MRGLLVAAPGCSPSEQILAAAVRVNATQRVREIFPEIRYRIDDLIAEADKVVARYTVNAATGTTPADRPASQ